VDVVALAAGNPDPMTGSGNWTWLIRGRVPTLVDAGVGNPQHLAELEAALDGVPLAQVIVTHSHPDHAAGVAAIAARMPSARFLKMPWADHDNRWGVTWKSLADGEHVDVGEVSAIVVHTPGHAPDHVCMWQPATRTLFGGDLVIAGTTVWIPASLGGDLAAYLVSLERVIALEPGRILPGHGPIITEPVPLLRKYVVHRRERELQVIDALRNGAATPSAIVARIYPALDQALVGRAEETVVAHLVKLEREGITGRSAEAWHIIDA
jgi:glyoxylase-like metal-dependent hydrolase (beta-lactamase superfamily II)